MCKTNRSISEIIDAYRCELIDRGYSQGTFYDYSKICRIIQKWWDKKGLNKFNEENAFQFCDEFIGTRYLAPSLTSEQRRKLRVIRMLLSIYRDEDFENYTPSHQKIFKTKLGDVFYPYIDWCISTLKFTPSTVETHKRVATKFDSFLWARGVNLAEVSSSLFEDFITSESKSNRVRYKGVLRNIYRYLYETGITKGDLSIFILKEPYIRAASKLPTTYTEEEIKNLISSVDRSTPLGKRNYLILLLASEYGMRASDIRSLSLKHIDWESNTILFNQQKTDIPVSYPLIPSIGNAIIEYLKYGRPPGGDDVIIVRHDSKRKGLRLSSGGIYSIVEGAFKNSNISNWQKKKHGPHSLRHSFASNLLKHGAGYYIISMTMGHSYAETTKTYLQIDFDQLRKCSLQIPVVRSIYYNHMAY